MNRFQTQLNNLVKYHVLRNTSKNQILKDLEKLLPEQKNLITIQKPINIKKYNNSVSNFDLKGHVDRF